MTVRSTFGHKYIKRFYLAFFMISKPNCRSLTRKGLTRSSHGSHKVATDAYAMGTNAPSVLTEHQSRTKD